MKFNVSKKVRYHNFGFIPSGKFLIDLYGKLIGHQNLVKRLQATHIINAINISSTDTVLDFGCGAGYITVELAKIAKMAYGIDVNPYVSSIIIPESLQGKLNYILAKGEQLPFEESYFDKILASEILPMVDDPDVFIKEIRRVIKHNGKLIVLNGAGHPAIKTAYQKNTHLFRFVRMLYGATLPGSYEEYCNILQKSFGTRRNSFMQKEDIHSLLIDNGFVVESTQYTPGYWAGAFVSWSQFLLYLRTGKTLSQSSFFLKFLVLSILSLIDTRRYPGGILCVASLSKNEPTIK